jgi:Recombination endonuclease VII
MRNPHFQSARRSPHKATNLTTPACWSWKVDERIRRKVEWYMSDSWSTDPRTIFEQCKYLLLEWQDFRCAICGRSVCPRGPNAYSRRIGCLQVDHDPDIGLVRGLLCRGCNTAEGRKSNRDLRYVNYRKNHPTTILGFSVHYVSSWQGRTMGIPVL